MTSAVAIPIYKRSFTHFEKISLYCSLSKLSNQDIYVICPGAISTHLTELFSYFDVDVIPFPDHFFRSLSDYNRLLRTYSFYSVFSEYTYLLIVQLDALVIGDNLDFWCNQSYSYIGAPWFEGFHSPTDPPKFFGVGNGGLSLRRVPDFLAYLDSIRYAPYSHPRRESTTIIGKVMNFFKYESVLATNQGPLSFPFQEDLFWSQVVPENLQTFLVPSPYDALGFSFEVNPRYLYTLNNHSLPFGCHAWQRYDQAFWIESLGDSFFCYEGKELFFEQFHRFDL